MLYQINHGCVQFAADTILENINFEIRNTEKIAIVGRNGCGKTTLLRLINGEIELTKRDSDEDIFIARSGNPTISYLKQVAFQDENITLEEEIKKVFAPILSLKERMDKAMEEMDADPNEENVKKYTRLQEQFEYMGGYNYDREYQIVFSKFGFLEEDKKRKVSEFSGGQRSKIAFIKLLLSKPDIMLLDEPTNHLDMSTVAWLEEYLRNYNRAVVIVSHDRMFLDNVVDVVYEIEHKTTTRYPGNYSHFVEVKKQNYEKQLKDYNAQQAEIARLQGLVERFKNKPTKVSMAHSKEKAIEHMEKIEAPETADTRAFRSTLIPAKETGNDVLSVNHLQIGYDTVLSEITFEMKKGEKIAVLGDNGTGKSTFLKTLVGRIPAHGGEFHFGVNVEVGYFDQEFAQYSSEKDILNDFWDMFPTLTQTEVRNALGAFLFTQDDVFKKVSMLSGGEKARLALCKIFQTRPNVLIFDEPTNHMDIVGKETLEEMLKEYEGTVLFVSHDRYFVKNVANKVLHLCSGRSVFYPFGYEEYVEKQAVNEESKGSFSILNHAMPTKVEKPKEEKNYSNPGKEKAKQERKLAKMEEKISASEEALDKLREEMADPALAADYVKLNEIQKKIEEEEAALDVLMEEYMELADQM